MLQIAYDPEAHLLCAAAAGARSDAENEQLISAIYELDRHGVAHNHAIAWALDLAPGSEPTDAHWRRRFALQRDELKAPRVFAAMVTTSQVQRGVLTAMNWISPSPPRVKYVHHATVDEAAAWIAIVQGAPAERTRSLFAQMAAPLAKAR
jgi:hypothetical protein